MGMTVNEMVRRARKHAEKGEAAEARRLFEEILQKFPGNRRATEGLQALGATGTKRKTRAGDSPFSGAAFGAKPATHPASNPKAQVDALINMLNAGRFKDVTKAGTELAKKFPQIPVIPAVLGVAFAQQQKFAEAIREYRNSLAIAPGDANVLNNLGIAYYSLGKHDEAIETYLKALEHQPSFLMAWLNLGNAQLASGASVSAIESFNKAIETTPNAAGAYHALGMAYQATGQFEDAKEAFLKTVEIDPNFAIAHTSYSQIHHYQSAEDPHLARLEGLVEKSGQPAEFAECVNFSLGKAWDDLGEYDKAYAYFETGNRARKSYQPYSLKTEFGRMARICEVFDTPPVPLEVQKPASPLPIFIVSMPRSGSTLVEQILGAHSKVAAGGEIDTMRRIGETMDWTRFKPTVSVLEAVREEYLSLLPRTGSGEGFVTDKMLANFQYLPLICACMPEAKVIHVTRDPRASCWSMYRHRFASIGSGYSYDLDDLANYYVRYLEMMAFCRTRYPDQILDLNYELLTDNPEAESRKLVEFAGLEWEAACLDFHKAKSVVQTTSLQQVRKKIYQGSSDAWRNYEKQLGDLVEKLQPALEAMGK